MHGSRAVPNKVTHCPQAWGAWEAMNGAWARQQEQAM